jgi:hypothetical protein
MLTVVPGVSVLQHLAYHWRMPNILRNLVMCVLREVSVLTWQCLLLGMMLCCVGTTASHWAAQSR